MALTETPKPACFNIKTLRTEGSFEYDDDLPTHCWESAHPHYDEEAKEIVNFLVEFGRKSYYVIYRIRENSSSRELLARVPIENPSYMHSFSVTPHYVILTEFPLVVRPIDILTSGKPFIHNFTWQPERGTRFLVIERSSGKLINQLVTDPFFSFHHANAYEDGENQIILDLAAYHDVSSLSKIFCGESIDAPRSWKNRLVRYHILMDRNVITSEVMYEGDVEFPRLDDRLDGKSYRYLYMTLNNDPQRNADIDSKASYFEVAGLVKLDMHTRQIKKWFQDGCYVVEPIFIPAPKALAEDEGVLLTVMYDGIHKRSYLLAINAHTMDEIARAELPWHIPGSFHGQYFSETSFTIDES